MPNRSIPKAPRIADELLKQCQADRDLRPILFEWYKHVAALCLTAASVLPESPAAKPLPKVQYGVLVGLLNRCFRLMMANVVLASDSHFVQATNALDRCIVESALKIQWLCLREPSGRFRQYLADGLKRDLKFKGYIEGNIADRGGRALVIEERMLDSIERCLGAAELTERQVRGAAKLPDLERMCKDLNLPDGAYIAIQGMGSHAIHGTWADLLHNYLTEGESSFKPRYQGPGIHHNQYVLVSRMALRSIHAFLSAVTFDASASELYAAASKADHEIGVIDRANWGADFELAIAKNGQRPETKA